jgi:Ni/Co efflux regulator RcnB
MRKSILLAALVAAVLFAPVTFAKGQQTPKEKTAKVEKKEARNEQKVADNTKKHPHKKSKKAA